MTEDKEPQALSEEKVKTPLLKRNWLVISSLIILPPLGVILTWFTQWPRNNKIFATVLSLLWFLMLPSLEDSGTQKTSRSQEATSEISQSESESESEDQDSQSNSTPDPTPTPTPTPEPMPQEVEESIEFEFSKDYLISNMNLRKVEGAVARSGYVFQFVGDITNAGNRELTVAESIGASVGACAFAHVNDEHDRKFDASCEIPAMLPGETIQDVVLAQSSAMPDSTSARLCLTPFTCSPWMTAK